MRIEDVLPLSPLQEGLLFHALFDAQGPDIYTMQIGFALDGPLDSEVLPCKQRSRLLCNGMRACGRRFGMTI